MAPGVFVCAFLSLTAPFRKIKSISLSPRLQYGLICFYCNRVYPSDDPSKVFGLLWIDVIVLLRCVFHFSRLGGAAMVCPSSDSTRPPGCVHKTVSFLLYT